MVYFQSMANISTGHNSREGFNYGALSGVVATFVFAALSAYFFGMSHTLDELSTTNVADASDMYKTSFLQGLELTKIATVQDVASHSAGIKGVVSAIAAFAGAGYTARSLIRH